MYWLCGIIQDLYDLLDLYYLARTQKIFLLTLLLSYRVHNHNTLNGDLSHANRGSGIAHGSQHSGGAFV